MGRPLPWESQRAPSVGPSREPRPGSLATTFQESLEDLSALLGISGSNATQAAPSEVREPAPALLSVLLGRGGMPRPLPVAELRELPTLAWPPSAAAAPAAAAVAAQQILSPPPLVPASGTGSESDSEDDSSPMLAESESDTDMPPLARISRGGDVGRDAHIVRAILQASPSSRGFSFLEDAFCPWEGQGRGMQMQVDGAEQPRHGRAYARFTAHGARDNLRWTLNPLPGASDAAPAPAQHTLEDELASLAVKVAGLALAHRQEMAPGVQAGLQDVANKLASLASMVQAGPPQPM